MEEILGKLGLKGIHLLTGLLGSSIALIYGNKVKTWKDKLKAVLIVLSGATVTGYLTPLILIYKPNWIGAEYSIAFVVGIFGMSIIKDVFSFLYDFGKSPMEYLRIIRGGKK
tara:strand:+ start:8208 stop:8543 length:336 start_codon:yes stop_codon:yes gene_type:complete